MDKLIDKIKENKILLAAILSALAVISLVSLIPIGNDEPVKKDKVYIYNEKEILKDEEYKGMKFSNIKMIEKNGYTTLTATVTNESENDSETEKYYINILDKEKNIIIKFLGYIPGGLKKGESKQIICSGKGKFKKAFSKEIVDYSVNTDGAN